MSLEIEKEVNEELRNEAYAWQFLNDYLSRRLTRDVVRDIKVTGLFGVIDALLYLELKPREIERFYNFGCAEDYNDPESFTEGILKIIWGMSKEEIRKKYGRYLNDNTIENLPAFNKNIQMLTSFCYEDDDKYMFIPNEEDLKIRFSRYYNRKWSSDSFHFVIDSDRKFHRIDGCLFRTVRFLVLEGYDFPDIDSLMDEEVEEIEEAPTRATTKSKSTPKEEPVEEELNLSEPATDEDVAALLNVGNNMETEDSLEDFEFDSDDEDSFFEE
jgi:hypothetical protein